MNFIHINDIMKFNNYFVVKTVSMFFLFFIIIILVKKLFVKSENQEYKYFYIFKIKDFFFTIFLVLIYFIIFVFLIFYLRISKMGSIIDLKPQIIFLKLLYEQGYYLELIILFLVIVCVVFIFMHIFKMVKNTLIIELLKIHLYLSFPKNQNIFNDSIYFIFVKWFLENMSLNNLLEYILKPLTFLALLIENTKLESVWSHYEIYRIHSFLYNYIFNIQYNFLLIPIIIIYDLYYNNYTISIIFNFLPFYFIYLLWFNFQHFWIKDNAYHFRSLIKIIYDLYYNKRTIKYLNIDKSDWDKLYLFISHNLTGEDIIYGTDMNSFAFKLIMRHRYNLIPSENNLYYNENTKQYIKLKGINKEFYMLEESIFKSTFFFYFLGVTNIFLVAYIIFIIK